MRGGEVGEGGAHALWGRECWTQGGLLLGVPAGGWPQRAGAHAALRSRGLQQPLLLGRSSSPPWRWGQGPIQGALLETHLAPPLTHPPPPSSLQHLPIRFTVLDRRPALPAAVAAGHNAPGAGRGPYKVSVMLTGVGVKEMNMGDAPGELARCWVGLGGCGGCGRVSGLGGGGGLGSGG